ncbi:hypothetical protein Tco_1251574, partial [Tanacetum coccineum]
GVRQGDPLSSFLFILTAKGLNAIINEPVDKCIFRGVTVGANNVTVSHLQYADGTIFLGEWSKENAKSLVSLCASSNVLNKVVAAVDEHKEEKELELGLQANMNIACSCLLN